MSAAPRHPHFTRWPTVEGYCTPTSVAAGGTVALHLSSRDARVDVEVVRVGRERVRMLERRGVPCAEQPVPADAFSRGCGWPVSLEIDTGADWPSGFYEVRLVAPDDAGPTAVAEAWFVLRRAPGRRPAPALLALATPTWNAYNQWGGSCLYSGASEVSFERPLERGYIRRPAAPDEVDYDGRVTDLESPPDPTHRRLVRYQARGPWPLWSASSGWHNWARRFVAWAESNGLELDFATGLDLHRMPGVLDGHRLLCSVGHDEYWSWEMRDTVDAFVARGGNWAILSGNTCFWQVRFSPDGSVMTCHKGRAHLDDPVRSGPVRDRLTTMWSDPAIGRPETTTTGLTFTRGGYHRVGEAVAGGSGGYTVHRADHWLFEGTGFADGDLLGADAHVVGYEVDGCAISWNRDGPMPTGEDAAPGSLEILATAPAHLLSITEKHCEAPVDLWASVDPPGDLEGVALVLHGDAEPETVARLADGHAVLGIFRSGRGTVVNVGSTEWCQGLGRDPAVERVTSNILSRLTRVPPVDGQRRRTPDGGTGPLRPG